MSEPWNCTGLIADLHTFQEKKKKRKESMSISTVHIA